jgi:hypothetical protein
MYTISSLPSVTTESLPFVVRCVRNEAELAKAVAIRRSAYGRHVPELAARFAAPEPGDLDGSSRVLVALAKLDGMPLGSMRYRTNQFQPLDLEKSVTLPSALHGRVLTEATRLAVSQAAVGRVVKAMLMKAMYLQCAASGIECMVVTARHPMDRFYHWLLFEDVFPGGDFIPMAHVGMIPHRVMACDVVATPQALAGGRSSVVLAVLRNPSSGYRPDPVPGSADARRTGSRGPPHRHEDRTPRPALRFGA